MPLKPFRQYSEVDVLNFYKLNTATGAKGTPVVISNSGFNGTNGAPTVFSNLASALNNGNTYSPRWEVYPAVRAAVTGEVPMGITLYDTLEVNQFGYSYLYDKQRKAEKEAVVSGEAVPILTKGVLNVYIGTGGYTAAPGRFAIVGNTGAFASAATSTTTGVFGKWLGCPDTEGYAPLIFDCVGNK